MGRIMSMKGMAWWGCFISYVILTSYLLAVQQRQLQQQQAKEAETTKLPAWPLSSLSSSPRSSLPKNTISIPTKTSAEEATSIDKTETEAKKKAEAEATATEAKKKNKRTASEEGDFSSIVGDMDLSSRLDCGGHKCFIPSKSNQDIGYLVERDAKKRMSRIAGAWKVAKWIDREFGEGLHLYIDAPFTVELNETMWKKVNTLVHRPNRRGKIEHDKNFIGVQLLQCKKQGKLQTTHCFLGAIILI